MRRDARSQRRRYLRVLAWALFVGLFGFFVGCPALTPDERQRQATGADISAEAYRQVREYAPLAPVEALPRRASLVAFCPRPRGQGDQASCVGWSSSYCARTILEAIATGQDPNVIAFSPSFLYNLAKNADCHSGTYISRGLMALRESGTLPLSEFPYRPEYCDRLPTATEAVSARRYRIRDYVRLSGAALFSANLSAIKQHLAARLPVVVALACGGTFAELVGSPLWRPSPEDYRRLDLYKSGQRHESGLTGHAMTVVAYDDEKYGGAVLLFNSWGSRFGEEGMCWVRYDDFLNWCLEAYSIYGYEGEAEGAVPLRLAVGLRTSRGTALALARTSGFGLRTVEPVRPGEKFRLEVSNNLPCHLYVFGRDTLHHSLQLLFPYTPQHSSFLGLTGTRLVPNDHTYMMDYERTEEPMLVIVSTTELNPQHLLDSLNTQPHLPPLERAQAVLGRWVPPPAEAALEDGELATLALPNRPLVAWPLVLRLRR
jgi:hypothetical protein